jgi:hypothetical protein
VSFLCVALTVTIVSDLCNAVVGPAMPQQDPLRRHALAAVQLGSRAFLIRADCARAAKSGIWALDLG